VSIEIARVAAVSVWCKEQAWQAAGDSDKQNPQTRASTDTTTYLANIMLYTTVPAAMTRIQKQRSASVTGMMSP
jgi:hypothetical protein